MEEHLLLNENAYLYEKPKKFKLNKVIISKLFSQISKKTEKEGRFLIDIRHSSKIVNNIPINYSICVFKFKSKPSFVDQAFEEWMETKIAYFVLVEFENYVVITKKNISGLNEFTKNLDTIDYEVLSTLFIDISTQYEKLGLKNMSLSDKAIRSKTMESNDLQENFSTVGSSNYIVDNLRLSTDGSKIALSLNTSRVNKFGTKDNLESFFNWAQNVVQKLETYSPNNTFLNVFAQPVKYETQKNDLIPVAILFLFNKIYDDFENNILTDCVIESDNGIKKINLFNYLDQFQRLLQIESQTIDGEIVQYFARTTLTDDLQIRINEKSITIHSNKLNKVKLITNSGYSRSITEYINSSNQFIINFDRLELVYTNKKLFRDNRLLGNINYFLNAFLPFEELSNVNSEKGIFTTASISFSVNSCFNFVESKFIGRHDFFVCDDLNKEWADHIGISTDTISFYHSKYKNVGFSASAFQDIVGQGLKNISNLSPRDYQLDSKQNIWSNFYNPPGTTTNISRLRNGSNIDDLLETYKNTIKNPNFNREIYLVVNFISKEGLRDRLEKLRDGEAFSERNEVIQILWFLSSFLSVCAEQGIKGYICCKP
ncbi:hypothetical protein FLTE109939_06465 [Flavobacterium terrigena]|uniref:Sporadically distributed protein, TIGR04141 family n=2 Tax=Flavobacterium terrigena TaxID=402734 RepID=A0A1H6SFY5_9FLAO|nr:hypothetical protein SAMN05660918_1234 [Flavobacterium terrigena]